MVPTTLRKVSFWDRLFQVLVFTDLTFSVLAVLISVLCSSSLGIYLISKLPGPYSPLKKD